MRSSFFITLLFLFLVPFCVYATSGCCSKHDGVSHCDTSVGRYVCNDKTYSPTCGCYKSQPSAPVQQKEAGNVGSTTYKQYCGHGEVFYSNQEALDSLQEADFQARKPLLAEIDEITKEKETATKLNLFLILLVVFIGIPCLVSFFGNILDYFDKRKQEK